MLAQSRTRESILAGAILGLAGPGKKISGIMPCTVIRPSDMADNILDRDKHPEWNGERTKMVYSFPADEKLWQRYGELRGDSLREHGDIRLATEFYRRNRDLMDEGADVAWSTQTGARHLNVVGDVRMDAGSIVLANGSIRANTIFVRGESFDIDAPPVLSGSGLIGCGAMRRRK